MPLEPEPSGRRVLRDIAGLLCLLLGVSLLATVLGSVDIRLVYGLIAVILIAGGIYLGRDRAETEGS